MANYIKNVNYAVKDALPPADANKVIRGTELNTEFDDIATAISTKLDTSALSTNAVTLTGDQAVSGLKTFSSGVQSKSGRLIGTVTLSTAAPSGGVNGDIWMRY